MKTRTGSQVAQAARKLLDAITNYDCYRGGANAVLDARNEFANALGTSGRGLRGLDFDEVAREMVTGHPRRNRP